MRPPAAGRESTWRPFSVRRNVTRGWAMARLVITSTMAARAPAGGGGEGEGRDAGYGGQRLAAEAQRRDGLYVGGGADLAGGVPQDARPRVLFWHARAVVPDQKALAAA